MRYLVIVAVLVVLGGGILLFTAGGDDDADRTAGATLTETARGNGAQVALAPEGADGAALPAAPQVSDDAIAGGRRSETARRETGRDAPSAPADAPLVTAALEDDEEIERRPLAVPQDEDAIERRPLAPQTAARTSPQATPRKTEVERRDPLAPAETVADTSTEAVADTPTETAARAPAETVAEAPAETVADTPTEAVADTPAETVAETVARAPAETVAEAPAEAVADTPTETVTKRPAETVARAPVETAAKTPAETVAEAPTETAADTPTEPVAEAPAEAVAEAPTETVAEAPAETVAEAPAEAVADTPTETVARASAETVAEAPTETVAKRPAETAGKTPTESAGKTPTESVAKRPAETVAEAPAPIVAEASAQIVARAPAETVARAPTERRQALVADGGGRDVTVRVIESRRLGAPSQTVTDRVLPGVRGIEARTGRRLETAGQPDRPAADVAGRGTIEETRTGRTVVAALRPGAPAGGVARGAEGVGPTFDVVRISAAGNAVIAGRAAPGADVVVLDRGTALGQVKANRRGEWVLVPLKPLPPGATELYIEASLPGVSPRLSENVVVLSVPQRSVSQTARVGPLAVLTPRGGGATRVLQASRRPVARDQGGPGVSLDVVDYDNAGNIVLSGRADPNAEIRVYTDNRLIGTARSDKKGDWQLRPDVRITPGDHELRVDRVSVEGKVLARSVLPFTRADLQGFDLRDGRVVVQPGNSLWRIARATYGSGLQFTLIYEANREQIGDPDLIFPGQVFKVPEPN